jgi:hypothetical protein
MLKNPKCDKNSVKLNYRGNKRDSNKSGEGTNKDRYENTDLNDIYSSNNE